MATRSKYRATRAFSVGGVHFAVGDEVTGAPLLVALTFGDQFVRADTARTRAQAEPADESTEPTTED